MSSADSPTLVLGSKAFKEVIQLKCGLWGVVLTQSEGFPDVYVVENLPANAGDVCSIPGSRRSLEKEMATHSNILAWKISWTQKPGGLQFMGSQKELDMIE